MREFFQIGCESAQDKKMCVDCKTRFLDVCMSFKKINNMKGIYLERSEYEEYLKNCGEK
jgi:hypothetical protein